ncbi:MAG: mechanosensitive ion channel domain-containing protein [Hyphomicrobium sp.]
MYQVTLKLQTRLKVLPTVQKRGREFSLLKFIACCLLSLICILRAGQLQAQSLPQASPLNQPSQKEKGGTLGISIQTEQETFTNTVKSELPLFIPATVLSEQLPSEEAPQRQEDIAASSLEKTNEETSTYEEIVEPVTYLKSAIEALEKDVEVAKNNDEALARQRVEIDALISGADLYLESLQPRYQGLQQQIEKLGPAPLKDQPLEAPAIAAERSHISALSSAIDGAIKTTGLIQYRARELLSHVQELRTQIFTSELFRRHQSPYTLAAWNDILETIPEIMDTLKWTAWRWQRTVQDNLISLVAIISSSLVLYLGLALSRKKILSQRLDGKKVFAAPFFHRAGVAGWVALLLVVPSSLALIIISFGFDHLGLWFLDKERHVYSVLPPLLTYIGVRSLALAIFEPSRPQWRILNLDNTAASSLSNTLTAIGFVYAVDYLLKEAIRILAMPLSVSIIVATLSSLALALLLFKIVFTRFSPQQQSFFEEDPFTEKFASSPQEFFKKQNLAEEVSRLYPFYMKIPLVGITLFILGASLSGYVALGRFIAQQVIVSGSLIILLILLHIALRVLINREIGPQKLLGRMMYDGLSFDKKRSQTVLRTLHMLADVLLILCVLPLILFTWGFDLADTFAWIKTAVFGFEVAHFHISPIKIVTAITLFGVLLFLTRFTQRWFNKAFVLSGRIEEGIANSLHKAIGYSGITLAVMGALSYAGLDITNIALVAGALSVGIGFGLQSIINNFVSGVILLIERPLKVGDLIVINGHSGRVRNIAVRSTEIETSERSTLIVPNSELISSSLTNWTHRNTYARVNIEVTTSYQADTEHVRNVLEKVASECPLLLEQPKPEASLEKFGANGFEFSLTAMVADVSKKGAAQSDLRHRIAKAFKDNGIEIPYAQYGVHLRDLDFIKMLLSRATQPQRPSSSEEMGNDVVAPHARASGI